MCVCVCACVRVCVCACGVARVLAGLFVCVSSSTPYAKLSLTLSLHRIIDLTGSRVLLALAGTVTPTTAASGSDPGSPLHRVASVRRIGSAALLVQQQLTPSSPARSFLGPVDTWVIGAVFASARGLAWWFMLALP